MSFWISNEFGNEVTSYTYSFILIIGSGAPKNLKKNSIDFLVPFDL